MPFYLCLFLFFLFETLSAESATMPSLVENMIEQFMQKKDVPGAAVAVFFKGKGYLFQFGVTSKQSQKPITSDTIFEIASITKVFTSTALAIEVQRGRMSLNDPIIKYLPEIRDLGKGIGQITLKHLATHTSSLPRSLPRLSNQKNDKRKVLRFLENWSPQNRIGTQYEYSNLAFGILGYALADVEKENYSRLIRQLITEPLGMNSTLIVIPSALLENYAQGYDKQGKPVQRLPQNILPGGGALRSTSADMLKFLGANLGVNGPEELKRAMQFAQTGIFKVNKNLTMGLGWQRFDKNGLLIIDKNGGVPGFSSYIGMLPDQKIGIVLLANKGKTQITGLGRRMLIAIKTIN